MHRCIIVLCILRITESYEDVFLAGCDECGHCQRGFEGRSCGELLSTSVFLAIINFMFHWTELHGFVSISADEVSKADRLSSLVCEAQSADIWPFRACSKHSQNAQNVVI